jgi:hypothetical protein
MTTLARKRYLVLLAVLVLLALVGVSLALGIERLGNENGSQPDTEAVAGHRVLPFTVCESSRTWTRPSEDEQAREVWSRPRYASTDSDILRGQLQESFFFWMGGNSELFDSLPLHGLWSADDIERNEECQPFKDGEVALGKVVWLYLLPYEAKEVTFLDSTYQITVEQTPTGFQAIAFDNALFPENAGQEYSELETGPFFSDYEVVIVDSDGTELARSDASHHFHGPAAQSP